jgi:hypothetical protein
MSVPVGVAQIRHVRMLVPKRAVPMPMNMRLARWIAGAVTVPMAFIMRMCMGMLDRPMHMALIVAFGQVQPNAEPDQQPRRQ